MPVRPALRAARAVLVRVLRVAVRVAVPVAVPVVGVPVAAEDDKDEDVDAHANQRQDEHCCRPENRPEHARLGHKYSHENYINK